MDDPASSEGEGCVIILKVLSVRALETGFMVQEVPFDFFYHNNQETLSIGVKSSNKQ